MKKSENYIEYKKDKIKELLDNETLILMFPSVYDGPFSRNIKIILKPYDTFVEAASEEELEKIGSNLANLLPQLRS